MDNLAGEEEVVVAIEAAGVLTEPATVLLSADGTTTVSLSVFTGIEGSFEGDVTVTGCCSSSSAPWSAEAIGEVVDTATESHTGTPTDTTDTPTDTGDAPTDPGTTEPGTTEKEEEAGGCGCTQGSRWSFSPWLARRRGPPGR